MLARTWQDVRLLRPETRRYLVGSALMGMAFSVPWTLFNLYLDRLGFAKAEIGSVQAAEAWGRALVAIPAAFVLARRRTSPILAWTAVLAAAGYFALPWLRSLSVLIAVNLARGLFDQVHHVAIAPFLFRNTSLKERALAFGLAEAVHTLMAVLGSFLCGRAVTWWAPYLGSIGDAELQAMAYVLTIVGLLPLAAAFVFARIPEAEREPVEKPPVLPALRANRALVVRFAIPQTLVAFGAGLVIPFLGLYFQDRFRFSPGSVGTLFAAGHVLMTVGFVLSPAILNAFGYVRGMVLCEFLSIPFFLVLAFTHSLPLAIGAFLVRGALMNTSQPILKNFMMEVSPPGLRELQNGVVGLTWGLGWVLGPLLGGTILDRTGNDYTWVMVTTVVLYALASTCTWLLLRPLERARA